MDDPIMRNADGIADVRHRRARRQVNGRTDPALAGGGPALVGANWYRFRSREHIRHELVVTTCFVWVVQGSGMIRTRGRDFPMGANAILRLPWRHTVEYFPDSRSPFSVGTIHLVPWHAFGIPVDPRPPFVPGDPLLDANYRRATDPHEGPRLLTSRSGGARNIIALGTYAIDRFLAGPVDETTSRALGTLIAAENALWNEDDVPAGAAPVAVELMTDFIIANIDAHLSVAQVAAAGNCSPVTAERLFTRYTGLPVLAWVRAQRMERAATLLRTTSLRTGEVARMVGFADPLYFSRVFRATYSVPPSRYATGQLRP
jgi:AraC-like DNA-binding protein